MKPHQAGLEISYDGTWAETVTETVEGGTSSGGSVSMEMVRSI